MIAMLSTWTRKGQGREEKDNETEKDKLLLNNLYGMNNSAYRNGLLGIAQEITREENYPE